MSCVAVSRPIAERSRAEAINEVVKLPAHPLFTFEDSKKSVSARKFNLSKYLLSQDRIAHLFSVNKQSCLPKASLSHKIYFQVSIFWLYFFFRNRCSHLLFFFSQEKFKIHSLTQKKMPEKKKYSTGKKKIQHFHSLTRFLPKNGKS